MRKWRLWIWLTNRFRKNKLKILKNRNSCNQIALLYNSVYEPRGWDVLKEIMYSSYSDYFYMVIVRN